jgi:hypothetical protein
MAKSETIVNSYWLDVFFHHYFVPPNGRSTGIKQLKLDDYQFSLPLTLSSGIILYFRHAPSWCDAQFGNFLIKNSVTSMYNEYYLRSKNSMQIQMFSSNYFYLELVVQNLTSV